MGNIKGWGGPMTLNFLYNDLLLNKQVIIRLSVHCRLLREKLLLVCFLSSLPLLVMFLMNSSRSIPMSLTPFLLPGLTLLNLMVMLSFWSLLIPCLRRLLPCSFKNRLISMVILLTSTMVICSWRWM